MKKLSSTLMILSIALSSACYSINAISQTQEDVVTQVQNSAPPRMDRSQRAGARLKDFALEKGIKLSWDNEKNRIGVVVSTASKLSSYDPDFLEIRESLAIEAVLKAKAQIIEGFNTTASAENILSMPGNPIAKQLEKERKQLSRMENDAQKNLEIAQREVVQLMNAVDQAQADELDGPGWNDRWERLLDAAIKKLDSSYDQQEISTQEKARVDELKVRLEKARTIEKEMQAKRSELEAKIKAIQGEIKKEQKSKIETMA